MKITSEKPSGRSIQKSRYEEAFVQLTPEKNCISGLVDEKDANKIAQALENWAKKNIGTGIRVTTTKSHASDKKPRVWLWWPKQPNTKADDKPKTKWVK